LTSPNFWAGYATGVTSPAVYNDAWNCSSSAHSDFVRNVVADNWRLSRESASL